MVDLLEQDSKFQGAIAIQPGNLDLLFHYNEFRIANANYLPKTRPQILVGGPVGVAYPNIHTAALFALADVVCLTCSQNPYPYHSSIYCRPCTSFFDVLKRLPKGFTPDFYWDNQVEHKHYIPPGIEMAPFPIIASVSHFYLQKSVEHVCELFDKVIPVSKFYGEILRKKYPEKILDLPFGLNWGSFDHLLIPCFEKTIDVCVTFAENDSVFYCGHRNRVLELAKKFKEKYSNRFKIEIVSGLATDKYIELLKKSRITINVTGINGPYNYRTNEAMCCGSMVFQYDWTGDFFQNPFSELFTPDVHGVSFNFENFDSKLLFYLENRLLVRKIAEEAYSFLKENYSYNTLYKKLIESVKNVKPLRSPHQLHHVDMVYYNHPGKMMDLMNFGIIDQASMIPWIRFNNLMVLSCTYSDTSLGQPFLTLSSPIINEIKKPDMWELCIKYYELAKECCPKEYKWLIEWNFFMLAIDAKKAEKKDAENIRNVLIGADPCPFDESLFIFKYYVNSDAYPRYKKEGSSDDFYLLNMELIKVIAQPKKRAVLYNNFAVTAIEYFLPLLP
jgi:glycosyltransferase involved in cell wall biosynthesis